MFQPISGFCLVRCSTCALHHLLILRSTHILWFFPSSVTCIPPICTLGCTCSVDESNEVWLHGLWCSCNRVHLFFFFSVPLCSTLYCRAFVSSSSLGSLLPFRLEGVTDLVSAFLSVGFAITLRYNKAVCIEICSVSLFPIAGVLYIRPVFQSMHKMFMRTT